MRTKLILLLLTVFSVGANAQIPTTDLVGHYDFNNGALTDNINNVNFTKTGNSATVITDRFGVLDGAISLNGDDLRRSDINFNLIGGNGPFLSQTISFWMKTATNDANTRIIYNDNNRTSVVDNNFTGASIYLQNGQVSAALRDDQFLGNYVTHSTNVSDDAWHHITVEAVVTSLSGTQRIVVYVYVDGAKEGGTTLVSSTMPGYAPNHGGNISFSRISSASVGSNDKYEDGIDELLFYTRLLSDAEVNTIAANTVCNVNIPDANFKAYLVGNTAINTNGDLEIQCSEATAFTGQIDCSNLSISDLTGIEVFTGLSVLNCSSNSLSSLDVSQNTSLTQLYSTSNSLTSLNISQNTALTHLNVDNNAITNLDVSQNSVLSVLYCESNALTTLDLSNTSLVTLYCNDNNLTSLNVANGNNSAINVANFWATNNPNLTCITVDDVTYSTTNWTNKDAQTSFSTNCNPAVVHYVDQAATGLNNGSSWANAYTSLHNAIADANQGEEIWIAAGTYKPHASSRSANFNFYNSDVKVYGGFDGTETQVSDRILGTNETILSGDLQGNDVNTDDFLSNYNNTTRNADNSIHVVNINATANNLLLDGLTISGAHNSGNATERGGAIIKDKFVAKLTIKNCIIKDNVSRNDNAGILAEFDLNNTSGTRGEFTIENCQFINNMSRWATGIYSFIRSNTYVDVSVANSLFDGNITGNLNFTTAKGRSGSAAWFRMLGNSSDLDLNFTNNTLVNNIDVGVDQSLDADKHAVLALSALATVNGTLNADIANSIFWNNKTANDLVTRSITDLFSDPVTSVNVYNSIDENNFNDNSITSTIATSGSNPLFTDLSNGDYTLQTSSSAIDNGDNSYVTTVIDLLGNQRIFNTTVDMGVYEYEAPLVAIEDQVLLDDFKLYPNPARNTLNILLEENLVKVEVYSSLGRKVLENNASEINISSLSSGMYLVKVFLQNGKVVEKCFLKE